MLEVAPLPSFDADAEKRDSTPMMRRAAASVTACEGGAAIVAQLS